MLESGLLEDAGDRYELSGPLPPLAIPATLHDSLLARLDRLAPGQGDRADRRRARPRVLPRAARRGRRPAGGGAARPPSTSWSRPSWSSAAAPRPRRPTASSTRWSRTPPTAPCSNPAASSSTPASPRCWRSSFPETAETQPELLAHHCTQAGLVEKAVDYWHRAGRTAMARSAMVEAAAQLTQALDLLAGLPPSPDRDHKELDLQIALGAALIATKGWAAPEVGERLRPSAGAVHGEGPVPAAPCRPLGAVRASPSIGPASTSPSRSRENCLRLAEQRQDRSAQAVGHRFLGATLLFSGQLLPALDAFRAVPCPLRSGHRNIPVYLVGPDTGVRASLFQR